ncbi:hypothetical protein F1880_001391 [Penicillium rolfsii]|nr:hypothetical protein F1880_001391 [Penicillium rolfsii]
MPSKNMDSAWSPAANAPRSRQVVPSAEADFLWVDCHDGKSQDGGVARTTQAFLQKKYHKQRRKTKLQQLKASMKALPPVQSPPFSPPGTENSSERENQDVDQEQAHQLFSSQHNRQIHHSLHTKVVDIIPVTSQRLIQSADFYFDYFRAQGSRRWYPKGQSEMLKVILRQSFDHPSLLEVVISMSAHDCAMNFKAQGASSHLVQRSLQDAYYIRSNIIRCIQAILNKPSEIYSEAALLVIGHLFVTEALEGNVKAVDAHTDGLRRVLHALGGLENLGDWPLANIYSCDPIRGLFGESPLAFDISKDWERQAFQAVAVRAKSVRRKYPVLGTCFFNSSWSEAIHPRMRTIIQSFRDVFSIYEETIRLNTDLPMTDHNCTLLLVNRLHAVPYDYDISPLNETIRLAMMAYILTRVWEFQANVENLVRQLRGRVEENLSFLEKSASNLLFWILFNGAFASTGFECNTWFISRLNLLARKLAIDDWEDVASALEGFFFVRRSTREFAKEFWETVVVETDRNCLKVNRLID